jgi:hypothetical protein
MLHDPFGSISEMHIKVRVEFSVKLVNKELPSGVNIMIEELP